MITVKLEFHQSPDRKMEGDEYLDAPAISDKERETLRRYEIDVETAEGGRIFVCAYKVLELLESNDIRIVAGDLLQSRGYGFDPSEHDDIFLASDLYGVDYRGSDRDALFYDSIDAVLWALEQAVAGSDISDEQLFAISRHFTSGEGDQ